MEPHALVWFQEQDSNSIDRLYSEPYILRAILRSVSPLAQQYLLRLTFVQGPFPVNDIVAWCITPELGGELTTTVRAA